MPSKQSDALLLQSIVENLPDMIFVKDAEALRFVRFNRAGESLLGHSRNDLIGKNDYDFFPTEQAEAFTEKDRQVLAGDSVVDIPEEPIQSAARGLRWLHTKKIPIRDDDGNPTYLLGISRDVTDLRDARLALQDRESRLRLVLEHFPGAVWTTDAELRITWLGGAQAGSLSTETELACGKSVGQALDRLRDVELDELHRVALAGESRSFAFSIGERDFEARVETAGGGVAALMGVALDVTERRRLEAERVEVRLQRAQRMEALGVLAGGIAHDFNNLLVGMLGNASLALLKLPPESPARGEIERLLLAAERATDLTRQMLAYSGKGRFVVEAVDLAALVRDTAELIRTSLPRRGRLSFSFADELPAIEADATQVRQVVMNLLTNAAEALPPNGGDVKVDVAVSVIDERTAADAFADSDLAPGRFVVLEVSDTGSGMDDSTRRRMFDPFFTTKPNGHGLGLAAALGIVRGHRGAIRVYSETGRGTTVRVFFPSSTGTLGDKSGESLPRSAPPPSTVLVIDDEVAVREFARAVLEHHGYEVLEANEGAEGLRVFATEGKRIGLVLLDLTMPGLDGEETFHELRLVAPKLPVILSSGYNEQQATSRFVGLGLAGFLRKPYRAEHLVEMVKSELVRPR